MGSRDSLRVGLTGGIGTGKSTALEEFRRLGAGTLSLDEMSHELSRKGNVLHRSIVRAFGRRCLDSSGELDRGALARRVFCDPRARRRLERATHPTLLREMRRGLARLRQPVVVVDAPLLFEAGIERYFDVTMTISAPASAATKRLTARRRARYRAQHRAQGVTPLARRAMSRREALLRRRAQWPLERKEALSDIVLRNDSSLTRFRRAVREYHRALFLVAQGSRTARKSPA
ncbi:MAG: dephospho-CoA kinase [Elusimicrobia bacterium]|nr:dephospho-CoA kinase [Elusimicrobiota bacterium]